MFDLEFLQDFKYVVSFLLRYIELPNIGCKVNLLTFCYTYIAIKMPKIDIFKKCVFIFRMQFFNILCFFCFHIFFGFYKRFSKKQVFEILYRGERCEDDTLSIILHNSTIWFHMMAILASFNSQRNRLSTNALLLYYR